MLKCTYLLDLPGSMHHEQHPALICRKLSQYNSDIVALSKMRPPDAGQVLEPQSDYILFYKGRSSNFHCKVGAGFDLKCT